MATLEAAEAAALGAGKPAETTIAGAHALARPLPAPEPENGMLGVISIARPGRAFSERQRELFEYLTNQAAISIENVDLHETIQRQAVTDELTGLFNHRRFQEVMAAEVERTRRFGQELGLIMLDIDDFKRVNDTYGHLQGDMVLREVARVLRESSREIDEPARYGGEEMAVALPQTGLRAPTSSPSACASGSRRSSSAARRRGHAPRHRFLRRRIAARLSEDRQGRARRGRRCRPVPRQTIGKNRTVKAE